MRLDFVDKFGRESTLYVRDLTEPVLTDDRGWAAIDFQGMFPQKRAMGLKTDPQFKTILDAFMMRPSPGVSDWFLEKPEWYEPTFRTWQQAMMVMTGRLLIRVSK